LQEDKTLCNSNLGASGREKRHKVWEKAQKSESAKTKKGKPSYNGEEKYIQGGSLRQREFPDKRATITSFRPRPKNTWTKRKNIHTEARKKIRKTERGNEPGRRRKTLIRKHVKRECGITVSDIFEDQPGHPAGRKFFLRQEKASHG